MNLLTKSLLVSIFAALSLPAVGQENTGSGEIRYTIHPGDILEVSVWKEPDLQREVLVRPDGAFAFPLTGDIQASGNTVEELRQEITQRLSRFVPDLVVTVMVRDPQGNRIYVIGQVQNPGTFVINRRVDVTQALSLAGGTTAFATVDDILILRTREGQQIAIPFNYGDIERGRNLEQNIQLEPGDVVLVP